MKKKLFWLILILLLTFSLGYYLYERYIPEKTNITKSETEESMKKLKEQYIPREFIVVFKENITEKEIEKIISDIGAVVVDSLPEIKNYYIKFNNELTTQEYLDRLDQLNRNEAVSMAVMNEVATTKKETDSAFNNNSIENNKQFDNALSVYGQPANVYYSDNGDYTFLYPAKWDYASNGLISYDEQRKEINFKMVSSKLDMYEDVVNKKIIDDETKGYLLDGEIDEYERNGLIVVKWIVKKDDLLIARGIIQNDNYYYQFNPSDTVSLDEFSLVLDSFIINK